MVAMALMVGFSPSLARDIISTGKVVEPGPERKAVETTSSIEMVKVSSQADIKEGKISISSPIARALIGKYEGDVAEVQAPGGVREYEIVEIRYV